MVRVTKAAIWSRATGSPGLYVLADEPLLKPEKKASAIWQKKGLLITSVNGSVMLAPPQVPVSACRRVESAVTHTIREMIRDVRIGMVDLILIDLSFLFNRDSYLSTEFRGGDFCCKQLPGD